MAGVLASLIALGQLRPDAVQRVSVGPDAMEANGRALHEPPALSADGRFIAFTSDADNLSPGDSGFDPDVFVRDQLTGRIERVSVGDDGAEALGSSTQPAIDGDGRFVAFVSNASNLVAHDANAALDVFIRNNEDGTTERVSVGPRGTEANADSHSPAVSGDGRFVAFASSASNLVPGDTNGATDIFVHDRKRHVTARVSVATSGLQADGESASRPAISADGRYIAFASAATNLVPGDSNAVPDVFVHDRRAGSTVRVSVASDGSQVDAPSLAAPAISRDGRFIAFVSAASKLVPGDANALADVFVHDTRTGMTERASVASDGAQAQLVGVLGAPAISEDGHVVAFASAAADLVAGDHNGTTDIFVRDRRLGLTSRVSVGRGGADATGPSFAPVLSADGSVVAFVSDATDLAEGDVNARTDVFVRTLTHPAARGQSVTRSESAREPDTAPREAGGAAAPSSSAFATAEPATFAGGYRTIATVYSQMAAMAAAHPGIAQLVDFGDTYSKTVGGLTTPGGDRIPGYDLFAMKVTNKSTPGPKPKFVLLGETHGWELSSTEVAMRMLEWLVQDYGQDADATWLVDAHEIWIVPLVNPDGRWYVELGAKAPYSGTSFPWRKNGNCSSGYGTWPPTSTNNCGVDLNRNSTFMWGGAGASTNRLAWNYRGVSAGSEPETQAMENLLRSLYPDQRGPALSDVAPDNTTGILVSLHSASSLVLWPWTHTSGAAPNAAGLGAIGRKLATFNGYTAGQWSTAMYVSSGTIDDWLYGELGVPVFTFEMGKHAPTMTELNTVWSRNRGALIYAAKIARTPYMTARGPDVQSLSATYSAGVLAVSATVSDARNGGDTITAAEYYADTPPWQSGAAAHALSPVDGAFNAVTESASAQLAIPGLSGRHTLYARARDAQGNWGPVSAVFFSPHSGADPIGAWSFDEGTGTTAFDSSSTHSDVALLNGTTWAAGHVGTALSFDGANDLATATGSDAFDMLGAVTVSAWIYPRSAGEAGKGRIVDKANGVAPTNGWLLHVSGNGTQLSFLADYSSTNLARHAAANSIALNTWQHVVVTWNGGASASGVHIYVNGREVAYSSSVNGVGSRVDDAAEQLKIGNDKSTARTFNGRIDSVQVWSRALSAGEVAALSHPSLIGAWQLDEGSGTTGFDSSPTHSDLTLLNGAAWVPGNAGTALGFDGVNDVARAVGSNAFDALNALTVSAWIRPNSPGEAGKGRIVDKANGVTPTNGWVFYLSGDGTGLSFLVDFSSTNLARTAAAGSIAMNTWQHVAVTWDGSTSASGVHIYVNGSEVSYSGSTNATGSRANDALEELKVGNDKSTARTFNGVIDVVQVWNRVLSPVEIAALAQ
jgi:Tol biopolymer transport system component